VRIGFIGLGGMGIGMAQNLIRAGHSLAVYNRTSSKARELDGPITVADSPAQAARSAEVVITMLADDDAVIDSVLGSNKGGAVISALPPGAIHASMSTISVDLSARLAEAHREAGQKYVAAPVFGRPQAAAQAGLWIVAGGEAASIERCRPLFEAMGRGFTILSERPEAANAVKLTGNFMIAAVIETLGEALALVRKQGVAPAEFLKILNSALFRSPVYEIYGNLIAEERFDPAGFRLNLGLKDVRLALAAADKAGVPMPLASLLHDRFMAAAGRGRGDQDWSSIAAVIAEEAGL
jgi:3-hydroxyisobutyrate dehydrogenase-like beta-hydroxyacid dehydrogenase